MRVCKLKQGAAPRGEAQLRRLGRIRRYNPSQSARKYSFARCSAFLICKSVSCPMMLYPKRQNRGTTILGTTCGTCGHANAGFCGNSLAFPGREIPATPCLAEVFRISGDFCGKLDGAPGWDRTSNPCLRRAVLYPLSYGRTGYDKVLRWQRASAAAGKAHSIPCLGTDVHVRLRQGGAATSRPSRFCLMPWAFEAIIASYLCKNGAAQCPQKSTKGQWIQAAHPAAGSVGDS